VLLAASAVTLLLAFAGFQRRDVTVGGWPWQRARSRASSAALAANSQ
jgi:hypothetical protein